MEILANYFRTHYTDCNFFSICNTFESSVSVYLFYSRLVVSEVIIHESIYYTIIIALENIVATGSTSLPSWILLRFQKIIRNTALKYTCKSENLDILTNYFRRHYTDYNVFLFAIHICNIFESSVSDCSLFIDVIFAIYLKAFLEIIYAERKSSPSSSCHYYVLYGHDYILHTRK